MTMPNATADEDRVLCLRRTFDAPRERVFRAWTDPEQLVRWWGPRGFTVPEHAMDVREGGAWRTTMRSPEGRDHVVSGVYREIDPPRRLAFTWGWETDGVRGHETLVTVELHERDGGTELVLTQATFETADGRDRHEEGWSSSLDCLADALAEGRAA